MSSDLTNNLYFQHALLMRPLGIVLRGRLLFVTSGRMLLQSLNYNTCKTF